MEIHRSRGPENLFCDWRLEGRSVVGAAAVTTWPRLVDGEDAVAESSSIECADRRVGGSKSHFHEAEAPRLTGLAVGDQFDGLDGAVLGEELAEIVFGRVDGQIAHIYFLHSLSFPFFV